MPDPTAPPPFLKLSTGQVVAIPPDWTRDQVVQAMNGLEAHYALAHANEVNAAIDTASTPQGSATDRFLEGVSSLNPSNLLKGVIGAIAHPVDTVENAISAQGDQFRKAASDFADARASGEAGKYVSAAGHALGGALPIIGPAAAHAGERLASGDVAGGLGESSALLAPSAAGAGLSSRIGRGIVSSAPVADVVQDAAARLWNNAADAGTVPEAGGILDRNLGRATARNTADLTPGPTRTPGGQFAPVKLDSLGRPVPPAFQPLADAHANLVERATAPVTPASLVGPGAVGGLLGTLGSHAWPQALGGAAAGAAAAEALKYLTRPGPMAGLAQVLSNAGAAVPDAITMNGLVRAAILSKLADQANDQTP